MTAEERLATIDRLHRPRLFNARRAAPRCAECGFIYPCLTVQIARGGANPEDLPGEDRILNGEPPK